MGCCNSKKEKAKPEKKEYSWDKRKIIDTSQYIIDGAKDETFTKQPGSIDGQQFVIQNCENSRIFLLDYIATVSVDDCVGCSIIIGPTQGSVFFRDCKECKCIVACQQFRTRDCFKMDFFVHCATQPIIESSAQLRFGCYQLAYNGLKQDFKSASLSLFNNNWSNIHDFTPVSESDGNWSLLPEGLKVTDLISLDYFQTQEQQIGESEVGNGDAKARSILPVELTISPSVTPLTRGKREKNYDESCFVIVFQHEQSSEVALKVIDSLKDELDLIQAKEVLLSSDDAARIFGSSSTKIWESAKKGSMIGLEFNGDDCIRLCGEVVNNFQTRELLLYSSPTSNVAAREIENFYNFCDMKMSA